MTEQALTIPAQAQHLMPALSVQQATQRYQAMTKFIQDIMVDGVDYGTIPGTDKPTLLKPGAEKLTTFFGLTVKFQTIEKVEDWSGDKFGGEPFFYYWFRCQLWRGETLIAEADGSCNSRESKYRWRWVGEDDLPHGITTGQLKTRRGSLVEFEFAVEKAETAGKYGKPAEYWQQFKDAIAAGTAKETTRKARNGTAYKAWEIDTTVYRVPNEDVFSQVNTVQKMAQKRALIAATLLAVNASEFFTQDLEDMDVGAYVDANYTVIKPNDDGSNGKAETVKPDPSKQARKASASKATGGKRESNGYTQADMKERLDWLLEKVQAQTEHYETAADMFRVMREIHGPTFTWINPKDEDPWITFMEELLDYVAVDDVNQDNGED